MDKVKVLPLALIPGKEVISVLGYIDVHLIRSGVGVEEDKQSLALFYFLQEARAILRAKVLSAGGNCLLSYRIDAFKVSVVDRTEMTAFISVSGDAALIATQGL